MDNFSCPAAEKANSEWRGVKPCRAQGTHLSVPRARVLPTQWRAAGCALGLDPGMSEHGVALPSQPEPHGSHGLGAEFCLRDQEEVRVRGAVPTCEPEGGARRHSGTGFRTGF